jgi:hypothetical protein
MPMAADPDRRAGRDEPLGAFGKRLIRIIGPIDDLAGDVFGHARDEPSAALKANHAQRAVVFASDKVPDDGLKAGLVEGRLAIG